MNTVRIELDIPELMTKYVDLKDIAFQNKIRELMLYDLIKDNKISFGKAAEILGTDKMSLISEYSKIGLPYFNNSIEEVMSDADVVKSLSGDIN